MRHDDGVAAVEFALVALPFLLLLLWIAQIFVFYLTQTSLDSGVNSAADYLRSSFAKASPIYPDAATLKGKIASTSGGMIRNTNALAVEIRPLKQLGASVIGIVDETTPDYGASGDPLVLRAQSAAVVFAPGFSSFANVRSSAIVRRKTK